MKLLFVLLSWLHVTRKHSNTKWNRNTGRNPTEDKEKAPNSGTHRSQSRRTRARSYYYQDSDPQQDFFLDCQVMMMAYRTNGALNGQDYASYLWEYCQADDGSSFWDLDESLQRLFVQDECPGDVWQQRACLYDLYINPQRPIVLRRPNIKQLCNATYPLLLSTRMLGGGAIAADAPTASPKRWVTQAYERVGDSLEHSDFEALWTTHKIALLGICAGFFSAILLLIRYRQRYRHYAKPDAVTTCDDSVASSLPPHIILLPSRLEELDEREDIYLDEFET